MGQRKPSRDTSRPAEPRHAAPRPAPAHAAPRGGLRLNVTSDPANLADVRHALEGFCLQNGLGQEAAADVGLCVNEAMANVTRHAYGGATDRPVLVTAHFDGSAVTIQVRDWGNGVNPAGVEPKQDPTAPGGLGLVCLRRLLDECVYTPQADGMLLTMRKRRPAACRTA